MNTPLTDAVDNASYPDPAAHREALRKLCRKLEEDCKALHAAAVREMGYAEAAEAEKHRLLGQIATMTDEREAAEARIAELEEQRGNWRMSSVCREREARLRAVTEAGATMRGTLGYLRDKAEAATVTRLHLKEVAKAACERYDAARSADLPPHRDGVVRRAFAAVNERLDQDARSGDLHISERPLGGGLVERQVGTIYDAGFKLTLERAEGAGSGDLPPHPGHAALIARLARTCGEISCDECNADRAEAARVIAETRAQAHRILSARAQAGKE